MSIILELLKQLLVILLKGAVFKNWLFRGEKVKKKGGWA